MIITPLNGREAAERTVHALGLDETATDLFSTEALCASLRRAGSFLCPTTPGQLVEAVLEAVTALDASSSISRDLVAEQLDLLVSIGDLVELPRQGVRGGRQLYLGPPSYVTKAPGQYLLLGVRPNGASLVDESVGAKIQYESHTRSLQLDAKVAAARLDAVGLHEIRRANWLEHPRPHNAAAVVEAMRQRLDRAAESGQVAGLRIIGPEASVRYYRGRWRLPAASDSGDFVARRTQAYGADLWCLVRIKHGVPRALVDLPVDDPAAPGCDEAWRLQAAIDAVAGRPQLLRVRSAAKADGSPVLDLFGPVPGWAQRYLELVGIPVSRVRGALISYRVPMSVIGELLVFLADMLWIKEEGEIA
ncbi:hypothetical protein [Sphaerimonospora thailandensis]|uniref:Uncharacterized protein n=1 Tax=Sphaerimonospora thailandensis TaxID=795644 RepID=A0A8J3RD02_9ACTN|nr:hypothetical protein [Sphaerimonospora thailandensis]GIH71559.1 hypothetical protein Mth01_38120 [Sphaerimonospora thailandensis]